MFITEYLKARTKVCGLQKRTDVKLLNDHQKNHKADYINNLSNNDFEACAPKRMQNKSITK